MVATELAARSTTSPTMVAIKTEKTADGQLEITYRNAGQGPAFSVSFREQLPADTRLFVPDRKHGLQNSIILVCSLVPQGEEVKWRCQYPEAGINHVYLAEAFDGSGNAYQSKLIVHHIQIEGALNTIQGHSTVMARTVQLDLYAQRLSVKEVRFEKARFLWRKLRS